MNSSSVTIWVARVERCPSASTLGRVVVPEGHCPSGLGEREDTVGNDVGGLGCEGRDTWVADSESGVRGSLFDASIYYI